MRSPGFAIVLAIMFFLFISMMGGAARFGMMGGGFMLSQMLFPFLIIAFIVLLVRPRGGMRERRHMPDMPSQPLRGTPEEILRQRFARGELTRDQYQDAILELLKDRYVSGELNLEDYESRVAMLISDARPRQLDRGETKKYV